MRNIILAIAILATGCDTLVNEKPREVQAPVHHETAMERIKRDSDERDARCADYLKEHPDLPAVDRRALAQPAGVLVGIRKSTAAVIYKGWISHRTYAVFGATETETWEVGGSFYYFTNDILTGWIR